MNAGYPESQESVEIDPKRLSDRALNALVESFILREGTDYGQHEVSLPAKKAQVMRLLCNGEAKIYFDVEDETCTLIVASERTGQPSPEAQDA